MISLIQHSEADFLWKVSLKILNSGKNLKTFIHVFLKYRPFIMLYLGSIGMDMCYKGTILQEII